MVTIRESAARPSFTRLLSALSRLPQWIDAAALATLCVVVALRVFAVSDIRTPLVTQGGDGVSAQYLMKAIVDYGWYTRNPDVGAPFGATMYDYPVPEPTHFLLIRLLALFGDDPALIFNLFYLFSFASVAVAGWWALRFVGVARSLALAGAFLFCLLPYHFVRIGHIFLASYFAVPIFAAHALRLALYRAPHVAGELRTTLLSFVLIAIAAGAGVYYAFFGCLFMAVGASLGASQSRRTEPLRIGVSYVTISIAVIGLSLLPNFVYHVAEGANPLVASRVPAEAEIYGLRITQLLLPSNLHRFGWMSAVTNEYNAHAPLINENRTASLGTLGSVGLLIALAITLLGSRTRFPRITAVGTLSIAGILFATIGGFGALFALLVTPDVRGLNRISVFIGFFAILAMLLAARRWVGTRPLPTALLAMAVFAAGAIDQIPARAFVPVDPAFRQRQDFFDRLQTTLPEGTAVYELPYMYFPEAPQAERLASYDLFEPYLRTRGYRWSFGDMHGRPSDLWNAQVSTLQAADFVSALASAGFGAIYIDRRGFKDRAVATERSIAAVLGRPLMADAGKTCVVYRIPPGFPPKPFVAIGTGRSWLPWTTDAKGLLGGSTKGSAADLVVANPGIAMPIELQFRIESPQSQRIALTYGDQQLGDYELLGTAPRMIQLRFEAKPGVSRLHLDAHPLAGNTTAQSTFRVEGLAYGPVPKP